MKHFILVITTFFLFSLASLAAHIIGGEMRYTYVGPGSAPNSKNYRITLWLARGEFGAAFAPTYVVAIYNNDNGFKVTGTAGSTGDNWLVTMDNPPGIQPVPIILPSCIQGAPVLNYTYATYSMNIELPTNLNGYTVVYQTCCRIDGMINVGNSVGSTYSCNIPGSNQLGSGNDSSPVFGVSVNVICINAPFTLNFAATDPDGDSLVYSLCDAYNGGAAVNAGFDNPAPPPYAFVPYNVPYTSANPFGTGATINPQTGIISGIAPGFGKYVVGVCINVYRNGILTGTHKKDLIVQVSDCVVTVANPMPDFTTCDGFTLQFSHTSTGANTVFWDFGVASLTNDTSNIDNPTFTFPDTGIYRVKFVINRGTSCADSATRNIGVYPGFFPGFVFTGSCFTNPYQFTDTTNTRYGVVNSWSWNFGDVATLADTSHNQNPQWTYPGPGPRDVRLIVTNSKGCIDTALVSVNVLDKPLITLAFNDTLICRNDSIRLNASGTGVFNWTPLVSIINPNTGTPTVTPLSTTWYYVNLVDNGCFNRDSVRVRVVNSVSLRAINDTTICQGDAIQLGATSDGLAFSWTPIANLNNPNIINPIAVTNNTTTYNVIATIGACSATDQVVVTTVPYPVANAGPPQTICYNAPAQLNGSHDGISFTWSPVSYLDNPNILNPVSSPPRTTTYVLTVLDNIGCPKPGRDTIVITVLPRVRAYAGRDTVVVVGQPLQLTGTGGVNYLWSPPTGLSSTIIFNPIGVYNASIDSVKYKLIVTDIAGCADSAYITVRVFKTNPYIFVPTAFTPNNDGRNDVIRPIAVGIQQIKYFSVYNRWGQLVFTTTVDRAGWDGRIGGRLQDSGVYVWMVSAVDYTGAPIFLKGTVTLIR
jgi:gliding motility-associated-like protein